MALTEVVELKHANQAGIDVQAEKGWEAGVIHSLFEELQGLLSDLFQLCSKAQGSLSMPAAPAYLGVALQHGAGQHERTCWACWLRLIFDMLCYQTQALKLTPHPQ